MFAFINSRTSIPKERTVEVFFPDHLLKTNKHGTKIIKVLVHCYKDTKDFGIFECRCGLMKDGKGINWTFEDECPISTVNETLNLISYDELSEYIDKLPS